MELTRKFYYFFISLFIFEERFRDVNFFHSFDGIDCLLLKKNRKFIICIKIIVNTHGQ